MLSVSHHLCSCELSYADLITLFIQPSRVFETVLLHHQNSVVRSVCRYKETEEPICLICKQVVGTIGYAAPEYIRTGRLTSKSDVWSFGVFLYELITGRRPLDRNRPKNEQKLLEWVRPHLSGARKFRLILDPRLEGKYNIKTAQKLAAVANCCLVRQAKTRPKMSEILEMINKIVDTTDNGSPLLPMKSLAPKDAPERSKRECIKMRFVDPIIGESGCWSAWRTRQ